MSSKIYKLENEKGEVYIGSTTKDLDKRLLKHKAAFTCYLKNIGKYYTGLDIFKGVDVKIVLLEDLGIVKRNFRLKKEREYMDKINCINKVRPQITDEERALLLQAHHQKNMDNNYHKIYYSTNREKYKQYYEDKRQDILAKKKVYYQTKKKLKEVKQLEPIEEVEIN